MSSSSSSAGSTTISALKDKASTLSPVSPIEIFAAEMKARRKAYYAEYLSSLDKKKRDAQIAAQEKEAALQARIADIRAFKAKRSAAISTFEEDMMMGQKRTTTATVSSEPSAPEANSTAQAQEEHKKKMHPLFKMTFGELDEYYANRRKERWGRYKAQLDSTLESRTQSLLYLYHEAASFVTFANLDAKIDEVVTGAPKSKGLSIMTMKARQLGQQAAGASDEKRVLDEREAALRETLLGTLNGRPGIERVEELASQEKQDA